MGFPLIWPVFKESAAGFPCLGFSLIRNAFSSEDDLIVLSSRRWYEGPFGRFCQVRIYKAREDLSGRLASVPGVGVCANMVGALVGDAALASPVYGSHLSGTFCSGMNHYPLLPMIFLRG